jgi:hypothetical protein
VPDFPNPTDSSALEPKLYRPLLPTDARPVTLAMRVRAGAPALRTGRLRELAVAVHPMLRLGRVATLVETMREALEGMRLTILAVALVTMSVLLLSVIDCRAHVLHRHATSAEWDSGRLGAGFGVLAAFPGGPPVRSIGIAIGTGWWP